MKIILAPMEGVVDHTFREMLTNIGGIDRCVTEFVRVTDALLPNRVFYRYCPELKNGGKTSSGTPVYVQILGGKPEPMALNAERAAKLGAAGIDINFGCPAKSVNRNDGGSVILKEPERVFDIVKAVRDAVPHHVPVTAKIRLGFSDDSLLNEIHGAVVDAGANELIVHARTREDGYKPPAYWSALAEIQASGKIPVIANGEIWSVDHARQCLNESACSDLMLGRGLLAKPDLALLIKNALGQDQQLETNCHNPEIEQMQWVNVLDLLLKFCEITEIEYERKYVGNRVKQWLAYLRRQYQLADVLFEDVKRLKWPEDICKKISSQKESLYNASSK